MAQIKERALEDTPLAEQKCNEQPAHTPIAVEERMNGFKLCVRQPAVDQHRQRGRVVKEVFKIIERLMHLVDWRRHEGGSLQGAVLRTNPVLAPSKLARSAMGAANPFEQIRMDLADEAKA